ncbi:hypothetical protein B1F73_06950 [Pseudomonas syringae]|nr:DUF1534 domain-containing protein [Pseudomonas syringae]NAP18243.1 DUF1534 domain-containing protein [Pseudomonas syringae]NAP24018.1 DUF1534 domain-containing protein [Pseudomonas syringae]NAP49564.1 DUF1534 domain-containing protein [Pseudomonas syringae]NAP85385.1 DUF1534 domain-containing protein [Pseudomonas syringae]
MRVSFLTLQRGNALVDALRHKSAPHHVLKIGRGASKSPVEVSLLTNRMAQTPHFQGIYWPLREQARSHGRWPESKAYLCITLSAGAWAR